LRSCQREDEGGSCWTLESAGDAGAATVVVIAMDGEMGFPNTGTFMIEWMAVSKKVVPHNRDCGLRRPNRGKIGGRAVAVAVVLHSHGLFGGNWQVMEKHLLFFYKRFISYRCVYKNGKLSLGNISFNTRRASLPTSDNTQPHSIRALIQAPSPSLMAVHRLLTSSRSCAFRMLGAPTERPPALLLTRIMRRVGLRGMVRLRVKGRGWNGRTKRRRRWGVSPNRQERKTAEIATTLSLPSLVERACYRHDTGVRWRRTRTRGAESVVLNTPFLVGGGWKAGCFCLS